MSEAQFEKVCKGLEELRNFADTKVHPIVSPENWGVYSDLCDLIDEFGTDAIALIRQQAEKIHELQTKVHELQTVQTARVVTLEEIKDGESYWLSAGKEFVTQPVICVHREDDARKPYITFVWQFGTFSWDSEDYGKRWRCWTQRPTDEQMKDTKWDE